MEFDFWGSFFEYFGLGVKNFCLFLDKLVQDFGTLTLQQFV